MGGRMTGCASSHRASERSAPSARSPRLTALSDLVGQPMPEGVRGALVRSVPPVPRPGLRTTWVPLTSSRRRLAGNRGLDRIRPGCVMLSWAPAAEGAMDVTARLGLVATEVILANWPGLKGDWSQTVHPTVYEVIGLHAALSVATDALQLANRLAVA